MGSDRAGPHAAADSDGAATGGAILASLDGTSTGIDGIGKSIGDVLKGVEVGAAGSDAVGRCFHLMMTALKDGIKSGSLTGDAAAIGNEMVSTISSMPVVSRLGAASREEERAKRRGNNLLVPTINYSAFDVNQRNNQPRTSADAIRKAKERAANIILNAVQSVGDEQVQAYALRLFANKPQAAKIVLGSGLKVPDNTEKKLQMLDNLTSHASELFKSDGAAKGRVNDDQSSALQVLYDAIVEPCNANAASTATSTSSTPKLTTTDYQKVLPGSRATVQRRVKKSKDRKTKFKVGAKEEGLMYSRVKKRKGWSKVSKELQKNVVEWLKNHPSIVESPTIKDTILVRDANTGEKVRVRKRLMMCSIRELYNSMYEGPLKIPEARDDRGREIISDTKFRAIIPPNFVAMRESHKVMCGCEYCIIMKRHQASLNAYRRRRIKRMKDAVDNFGEVAENSAEREAAEERYQSYKAKTTNEDGSPTHPHPKDALLCIQCGNVEGFEFPHWRCVLRRCSDCPAYEVMPEEAGEVADDDRIKFHTYESVTSCRSHPEQQLPLRSKSCPKCDELIETYEQRFGDDPDSKVPKPKAGKISTRKYLMARSEPIGIFIKQHYLKALEKYAYHRHHVLILSNSHTGNERKEVWKSKPGDVLTHRDYAERLTAALNNEIMSMHFGGNATVSMEGCSVEHWKKEGLEIMKEMSDDEITAHLEEMGSVDEKVAMQFHAHLADDKMQNAYLGTAQISTCRYKSIIYFSRGC